jgi:hypothetical protein
MRSLNLLLVSLLLQLLAGSAEAAPEWRHAAHHDRKLYAEVLLGDERGTYWDARLPDGWVWLKEFKPPADDYYRLDQVGPRERDGKVVFAISKWNFFEINRKQFSLKQLAETSRKIDDSKDVEFRESDEERALLKKFSETDEKQAADAAKGQVPAEKLTVKHAEMGFFVVKAKSGKVATVLFERFSGTALVRMSVPSKAADKERPSERREAFDTDAKWSVDVDGDGTPDLDWVPRTDTEDAYLKPAGGAAGSQVGSAK